MPLGRWIVCSTNEEGEMLHLRCTAETDHCAQKETGSGQLEMRDLKSDLCLPVNRSSLVAIAGCTAAMLLFMAQMQ